MSDLHSLNEAINKKAGRKLLPSIAVSLSLLALIFLTMKYLPIAFAGVVTVAVLLSVRELTRAFKTAEFDIMYGEGISKIGEILDIGVEHDIIEKSGSWFSYGGSKLGQGRDSVKAILKDNPELMEELEQKILEQLNTD